MEAKLNLEARHESGKGVARKLRRAGRVPGVVYGGEDDTVMVSMEAHEALNLFQAISVENTILELNMGTGSPVQALVREIQAHPHRTELVHVDFLRIQAGVAIEVSVPLDLVGTPEGVRNEGGTLDHIIHDVPVKCVPSLIPEVIEVAVGHLEIGDAIRARELVLPEGVENLLDPDQTICAVSAPRAEEAAAEDDLDEDEEGREPLAGAADDDDAADAEDSDD